MKIFLAFIALLCSFGICSQQTPKTPQEMEAFLKTIQKKSDSLPHVLKYEKNNRHRSGKTI